MAKREKKTIVAGVTAEQFQESMACYALADSTVEKITAKMNMEITKIREKNANELADYEEIKATSFEVIQSYCMANKDVLFAKQRHMDTVHGKVGLRLGMPKLKTLPKFTWDRVLEKLDTIMPEFVRTKKEVDKESLLLNRDKAEIAKHLNEVGVYVDQEEAFFIELKKEENDVTRA